MNAKAYISHYVNYLKQEYPFLTEADSIIIRKTLFNLEDAFKRYFNKQGGYPNYKNKFSKNSYNTSAVYRKYKRKEYCNIEIDLTNKQIKLPKLKWLNIRGYRNLKEINERIYKCCNCNNQMDRDLNASINIMFEGLKIHFNNFA